MIKLLIGLAICLLALLVIGHILSLALSAIFTAASIVAVLLISAGLIHLLDPTR